MKNQLNGMVTFSSGKTSDYDIWTLDLSNGQIAQITSGNDWNDKPCFSPDGECIAFTSNRTGFLEIYKAPATGGEATQLTHLNKWCDSPRFSPDGTKIAYVSNEAGNNDIWVMGADGENRQQVTEHNGSDTWVDWTPDGQGLMWSSDRDENDSDIWFLDLASGQKSQLTTEDSADFNPVASPCGTLIAFVSNRQNKENSDKPFSDRDRDVWMMGMDGSHPVRMTENQGCDACICWSPCGSKILYASNNDRTSSHLRVMDVSSVVAAFAQDDQDAIERAAKKACSEAMKMDRDQLKSEINAVRNTTFVTRLMPEKWVEACYPAGYFGQERFPHWIQACGSQSTKQEDAELQSSDLG